MRHLHGGRVGVAVDDDGLDAQPLELDHDLLAQLSAAQQHDADGGRRQGGAEAKGMVGHDGDLQPLAPVRIRKGARQPFGPKFSAAVAARTASIMAGATPKRRISSSFIVAVSAQAWATWGKSAAKATPPVWASSQTLK